MNRFFILFIAVILVSSLSYAQQDYSYAEVEDLGFFERIFSQPFRISGGTVSAEDVMVGETLDAGINIKFTKDTFLSNSDGKTYYINLFFIQQDNPDVKRRIGNYYFSVPHEEGDWIKVNVRNIDTTGLNEDWCDKAVKIAGRHYVWEGDARAVADPSYEDEGEWVIDAYSEDDEQRFNFRQTTDQNFILRCESDNPCTPVTFGYVCHMGERALKKQTDIMGDDGECLITYDYNRCPAGSECDDGDCVRTQVCEEGDRRCALNGKVVEECVNNAWTYSDDFCTETNACLDGECTTDEKEEDTGDETGETGGDEASDSTCDKCQTPIYCSDGETIFLDCVDGCYEEGSPCPDNAKKDTDETEENATIETPSGTDGQEGVPSTEWIEGYDNTMVGVVGGGLIVLILVALILFVPPKKPKKRVLI